MYFQFLQDTEPQTGINCSMSRPSLPAVSACLLVLNRNTSACPHTALCAGLPAWHSCWSKIVDDRNRSVNTTGFTPGLREI